MPNATHMLAFGLVALGLVLTPGPNMVYAVADQHIGIAPRNM
jgi:threonine/homoserine/homoserine lactone efflux protein